MPAHPKVRFSSIHSVLRGSIPGLVVLALLTLLATGCASTASTASGGSALSERSDVETVTLPLTVFGDCAEKCAEKHTRCHERCDKHDPFVQCYKGCDSQTRACFRDCGILPET